MQQKCVTSVYIGDDEQGGSSPDPAGKLLPIAELIFPTVPVSSAAL